MSEMLAVAIDVAARADADVRRLRAAIDRAEDMGAPDDSLRAELVRARRNRDAAIAALAEIREGER